MSAGGTLTVRLSEAELRQLAQHAAALKLTKTDVVRLALESLNSSRRVATQLDAHRDQLREELRHEMAQTIATLADKNRRATLLLLKVLKAPGEAEAALENVFKV